MSSVNGPNFPQEEGLSGRKDASNWWTRSSHSPKIALLASFVLTLAVTLPLFSLTTGRRERDIIGISQPPAFALPGAPRSSSRFDPPVRAPTAAVAAESPLCSEAAVQIMREGGNAVDAAVAATLCQGVVNGFSSGIGGGCVILLRLANGTSIVYDAREKAPMFAHRDMFVNKHSEHGGLSIAVPGELKGLEMLWNEHKSGNISWHRLFTPSIKLANEGWEVTPTQAWYYHYLSQYLDNPVFEHLAAIYRPKGKVPQAGDIVRNEALARMLQQIARDGNTNRFYYGSFAEAMVSEINAAGGNFTVEDFKTYEVVKRKPLITSFEGHEVLVPGPPYAGSLVNLVLNILHHFDVPTLHRQGNHAQMYHWLIEALKFAYSHRLNLGDPDFVNLEARVQKMLSKDHAQSLASFLMQNATFQPEYYIENSGTRVAPTRMQDQGTSHISVVDAKRNAVSLTTTINLRFGSKIASPSLGIVFNDEMDDFSTPGESNHFGYPPSAANFIEPGKRPLSSMCPMIVTRDNSVAMVLGGAGGSQIITSTLQVLLNVLALCKNANEAVSRPRLHHQLIPNEFRFEEGFPMDVVNELTSWGHKTSEVKPASAVGAIVQDSGILYAASDYRKGGQAAGW